MTTIEETESKKPDPKFFIGIYEEIDALGEKKQNIFAVRTTDRMDAVKKYKDFISALCDRGLASPRISDGPLLEIPLAFHKAVETVLMSAMGLPPIGYQDEIDDTEPLFVMVFGKKDGGFHAMPLVNNGSLEIGMGAVVRDSMPETGGEALSLLATELDRYHSSIGWRQR